MGAAAGADPGVAARLHRDGGAARRERRLARERLRDARGGHARPRAAAVRGRDDHEAAAHRVAERDVGQRKALERKYDS